MSTTKETKTKQQHILMVTDAPTYGIRKEGNSLYMIIWQRLANSGFMYIWAESEKQAFERFGYNPDFVKHTIVKIDPSNMPVEIGNQR